jgi:hypothetical protein
MALETGLVPKDLNAAWPLEIDPINLGAAHLRLLKKIVKAYTIGEFPDRAAFITWFNLPGNSSSFLSGALAIIGNRWFVINTTAPSGNNTDGLDFFVVAPTVQAVALSHNRQLGQKNSLNTSGLSSISSSERRRPLVRFVNALTGTEFDTVSANAAFPNGNPVANDICIQLIPGSASYSFIKTYLTSGWANIDITIFSKAASFGSFSAQMLSAISVDSDRVRTGKQEIVGLTNMQVFDPDGFGVDELTLWYGPKEGLISLDGEIIYPALLKLNAIRFEAKDGTVGAGGGSVAPSPEPGPAPVPPTDATILASCALTMTSSGAFTFNTGFNGSGEPLSGAFLSNTTPGIGDQFEVNFQTTAGAGVSGNINTWQVLTSNRTVNIFATSDQGARTMTRTRSVIVSVRKSSAPATVVSKTVSLSAQAVTVDGIEP